MPFKMHKIIFFFSTKKNNLKKYVCLPYLKFSDPLPETHLFFYFNSLVYKGLKYLCKVKGLALETPILAAAEESSVKYFLICWEDKA